MKGLFFTELLEMIEGEHGLATVDRMISTALPPTVGVFTSMGNYTADEFFGLVNAFAALKGQPPAALLRPYGRHFFRCLLDRYEKVLDNYPSTVKALHDVNELVRRTRIFSFEKQQPKAEFTQLAPATCQLIVRSKYPLQHLILGAIEACIAHYGEPLEVALNETTLDNEIIARFDISPKAPSCLTTFS